MKSFSILALSSKSIPAKQFLFILTCYIVFFLTSTALQFDPAGVPHVGNGNGGQFIGGQCLSNADCASTCCANPIGICSGIGAQNQAGKTGCGFGGSTSTPTLGIGNETESSDGSANVTGPEVAPATKGNPAPEATAKPGANIGGPAFDPAGEHNVGNGQGVQFIGGQCLSGADCASTCCAGPSGICSGLGAQTQAGKTGCGFVSKKKLVKW